jgi:hypothetical protein
MDVSIYCHLTQINQNDEQNIVWTGSDRGVCHFAAKASFIGMERLYG